MPGCSVVCSDCILTDTPPPNPSFFLRLFSIYGILSRLPALPSSSAGSSLKTGARPGRSAKVRRCTLIQLPGVRGSQDWCPMPSSRDGPSSDYYADTPSADDAKGLKHLMPFGQVPILFLDDKIVAQTGGICRFAGKVSGLYPEDLWDGAKVDEVIDFTTDMTNQVNSDYLQRFSLADRTCARILKGCKS